MEEVTLGAARAEPLSNAGCARRVLPLRDQAVRRLRAGVGRRRRPARCRYSTASRRRANIDRASKAAEAARLRYQAVREEKRVRAEELGVGDWRRREAAAQLAERRAQDWRPSACGSPTQPARAARLGGGGAVGPRRREPRRPRGWSKRNSTACWLWAALRSEAGMLAAALVGDVARRSRRRPSRMTRTWRRALWLLPLLVLVVTGARLLRPQHRAVGADRRRRGARRCGWRSRPTARSSRSTTSRCGRASTAASSNIPDAPASVVAAGDEIVRFDDGPVAGELAAAESERLAATRSRCARRARPRRSVRERAATDRAPARAGRADARGLRRVERGAARGGGAARVSGARRAAARRVARASASTS